MRGLVAEVPGGRTAERGGWGSWPGWLGVLIVITAALAGTVVTVASHAGPGVALGAFVVGGTVVGGTVVRARRAYLIVPVPAPAYAVAAAIAGLVRDRAADTSRTVVALNAAMWLAHGFVAMSAATFLAAAIAAVRWARQRSADAGQLSRSVHPGDTVSAADSRRPGVR